MEKPSSLQLRDSRALSAQKFQRLAQVPPQAKWFANLDSVQTRRAYESDIRAFMAFVGIALARTGWLNIQWALKNGDSNRFPSVINDIVYSGFLPSWNKRHRLLSYKKF